MDNNSTPEAKPATEEPNEVEPPKEAPEQAPEEEEPKTDVQADVAQIQQIANALYPEENDEEVELETLLDFRVARAQVRLEQYNDEMYNMVESDEQPDLARIQNKRQREVFRSMYRYVKHRHDVQRRNGRCPTCTYFKSIIDETLQEALQESLQE